MVEREIINSADTCRYLASGAIKEMLALEKIHNAVDPQEIWAKVWEPKCTNEDGTLNLEVIKTELSNHFWMQRWIPDIYAYVTGGLVGRWDVFPAAVMISHDDHVASLIDEAVKASLKECGIVQEPTAWETTNPAVCAPFTKNPTVAQGWRELGYHIIEYFTTPPRPQISTMTRKMWASPEFRAWVDYLDATANAATRRESGPGAPAV